MAGSLSRCFFRLRRLLAVFLQRRHLLVLPIVRWWRPGRDMVSLLQFALAGLICGFLSPPLLRIGLQSCVWFGMGAGSGLIVAVLYFYLTDGTRRAVLRSDGFRDAIVVRRVSDRRISLEQFLAPKPLSNRGSRNLDDLGKRLLRFQRRRYRSYASIPITIYHRRSDATVPPVFESLSAYRRGFSGSLYSGWRRWAFRGRWNEMEALLPDVTLRSRATSSIPSQEAGAARQCNH